MTTTRKAGRPHKGQRHAFLVKLSPEKVRKIQLLAEVTERTYVEVVEVVATDALNAAPREDLVAQLESFRSFKGERRPLTCRLPMAQSELVFDLARSTQRTYQDVLELLLGEGLRPYDMDEMLDAVSGGQGRFPIAV